MRKIKPKPIIVWFSITLLTIQLGCAHAPPSEQVRAELGAIGVVSARFLPKVVVSTPAKGQADGASRGAELAAEGMVLGGIGTAGPFGLLLGIMLVPVAAPIGYVVGRSKAESAEKVDKTEAALTNVLTDLRIQETMRDHFLRVAREQTRHPFVVFEEQGPTTPDEELSYASLAGKGIDTVLEISVLNFGLRGPWSINPPLTFFMTLRTRLIRTVDGEVVYVATQRHKGKKLKFVNWATNDAQPLREDFDRCYKNLPEGIVNKLFFLSDFPSDSRKVCGLRPIYPKIRRSFFTPKKIVYVKVDSLQPTLQWESFPTPEGKPAVKMELLSRISDVTYDLKIWRVEYDLPMELAYTRQRLLDSSHKIEHPLEPSTRYFWTVRANFKLDGQSRVTKWSFSRKPRPSPEIPDPCRPDYIPIPNYLRFITPGK